VREFGAPRDNGVMGKDNLFDDTSPPLEGERFETLLRCRNLVVERIVSSEAISPSEYVQVQDEGVVLLRDEAERLVAGRPMTLAPGDHLFLPAGTPLGFQEVVRAVHFWKPLRRRPDHGSQGSPGGP
jgi:cupin 2 domain-containing protein